MPRWLAIGVAAVVVWAAPAGEVTAQGPSCYLSPSIERTYIFLRELDSDGNPVNELGGQWVDFGAQAPVVSSTGSLSINYRPASSDREIMMDPAPCQGGNVISVP